jgi:hypothetical protein
MFTGIAEPRPAACLVKPLFPAYRRHCPGSFPHIGVTYPPTGSKAAQQSDPCSKTLSLANSRGIPDLTDRIGWNPYPSPLLLLFLSKLSISPTASPGASANPPKWRAPEVNCRLLRRLQHFCPNDSTAAQTRCAALDGHWTTITPYCFQLLPFP